jgi:hypothetical protein
LCEAALASFREDTSPQEYARSLNIILEKVPPGLTWLSQPADAVWIKPMKDQIRALWVQYLRGQLQKFTTIRDGHVPCQFWADQKTVSTRPFEARGALKQSGRQALYAGASHDFFAFMCAEIWRLKESAYSTLQIRHVP